MSAVMPYSSVPLDRASDRRADAEWIARHWSDPGSRVVPLWRDECLVSGGTAAVVPSSLLSDAVSGMEPIFLGLDGDTALFAADLSGYERTAACAFVGADTTVDVRSLFSADGPVSPSALAYARGLCHWHRQQRFCGACGASTTASHGGHLRTCTGCGKLLFTRIEPAVITLIESPDGARCLLARNSGSAAGRFALVAGFVEIGESLEDAARRESGEEVGVELDRVRYQGSQGWPFPAGLMVGFHARAASEEFVVDGTEIAEARWFDRAEFADHAAGFRPDSIETHLARTWLDNAV